MSTNAATAIGATITSIVVNGTLAGIKITAGVLGNSYALIADGIESLNDILSSLVVLVSLKVSSKPADDDHPFGHGRAEQLGALFSALSLLGAGATIAYQSTCNMFGRHESPAWFTLPVLLVVVITKEILSRYALRKSNETTSSALRGDAWHHRSDAITSGAAFFGILIALAGGPGWERADDVAALIGCVVIAVNGFRLLKVALHENMDGAPSTELLARVRDTAGAVSGVCLVEKLRMKKTGLGYYADIHIQVGRTLTVEAGHGIGHEVKAAIMTAMPQVHDVVTHIEPFGERDTEIQPDGRG